MKKLARSGLVLIFLLNACSINSIDKRSTRSEVKTVVGEFPPLPNGEQYKEDSFEILLTKREESQSASLKTNTKLAIGDSENSDLECVLDRSRKINISGSVISQSGKKFAIAYITNPCLADKRDLETDSAAPSGIKLAEGYIPMDSIIIGASTKKVETANASAGNVEGGVIEGNAENFEGCTAIELKNSRSNFYGSEFRGGFKNGQTEQLEIKGSAASWEYSMLNKILQSAANAYQNSTVIDPQILPGAQLLHNLSDLIPANNWRSAPLVLSVQGKNSAGANVGQKCDLEMQIISPIVFDLSLTQNFQTISVLDQKIDFDFNADHRVERSGWINRASGFLALDRNQNGKIDNGSELFGEHTAFKSYGNGYDALADEDSDHNGFIDSTDRVFSKLVVWIDDNQDGLSQSHEVKSLRELGISKISVGFETLAHSKGVLENQVRFKSKFFGPAYCSVNGCNSYDVFFATFRTSTEVAKNK